MRLELQGLIPRMKATLTLVLLLTVGAAGSAWAEIVLNLTSNQNSVEQTIASSLLSRIYVRAGLKANILPVPGVRASLLVKSGSKDGEVARIKDYADENPDLIKIEPAYYRLKSTAFAKGGRHIIVNSRDDLRKYRVGIIRGIAHAKSATQGLDNVIIVNSAEQLYRMLDIDRIDIAIDTDINGTILVKQLGLKDIKAAGVLAKLDLFHLLHPTKKDFAPKIGAAIRSMQQSGELATMINLLENQALNAPPSE